MTSMHVICGLGPIPIKILATPVTHDAFVDFHVESKFQLSRLHCLLVMSKLSSSAKIRKQKLRYYELTRSPNKLAF